MPTFRRPFCNRVCVVFRREQFPCAFGFIRAMAIPSSVRQTYLGGPGWVRYANLPAGRRFIMVVSKNSCEASFDNPSPCYHQYRYLQMIMTENNELLDSVSIISMRRIGSREGETRKFPCGFGILAGRGFRFATFACFPGGHPLAGRYASTFATRCERYSAISRSLSGQPASSQRISVLYIAPGRA